MTVCLWIVIVLLVGTVTQLSIPDHKLLDHIAESYHPNEGEEEEEEVVVMEGQRGQYAPRSKVNGSLATKTISRPLSLLSILNPPPPFPSFQLVPELKYKLAASSVTLLTYRLQTTLWPSATAKLSKLRLSGVSPPVIAPLSTEDDDDRAAASTKALMRLIVWSIAFLRFMWPKPLVA